MFPTGFIEVCSLGVRKIIFGGLVENIDFLEKNVDTDAWIAVKSLVKLYKDKFVCKLCSEPAEKESIQ